MSACGYGSLQAASPQGGAVKAAGRKTLALAVACIAGAVLLTTYSRAQDVELVQTAFAAPRDVMHGHVLAARVLPMPLDKEIAEDIALLTAQQKIVNDAEAKLATAYGNKPLAPPRGAARMQAAQSQGLPDVSQFQGLPEVRRSLTGKLTISEKDPRPASKDWVEDRVSDHETVYHSVRHGPADLAEVDGDKVADWNDFFNNMNARVDAPRWGKTNMVIDNLDDIEPCRVDCDKDGGNTGTDFAFFGNMLALNQYGHIIDNLDDIDACSVDC